jgi:hypothetical protein
MIIFTPFPNTKEALMQIRPDEYHFYEYNLSSLIEAGYPLYQIVPQSQDIPEEECLGTADTPDFDIQYGNFILSNPDQFFTLMRIIDPVYQDPCACVIIYIAHSPTRDVVLESLCKLIQQRYGYNSYIINTLEDLYDVRDDSTFSVRGILAMQEDSERALSMGFYGPIDPPKE